MHTYSRGFQGELPAVLHSYLSKSPRCAQRRFSCFAFLHAVAQGRKWRLNFHYGGIHSPTFVSAFVEMLNLGEFRGGNRRKITFQLGLMHNDDLKKTILKEPQASASVL
jgi:hypothetical protein